MDTFVDPRTAEQSSPPPPVSSAAADGVVIVLRGWEPAPPHTDTHIYIHIVILGVEFTDVQIWIGHSKHQYQPFADYFHISV